MAIGRQPSGFFGVCLAYVAVLLTPFPVQAQWTAIRLQPQGADISICIAGSGGQQGGYVRMGPSANTQPVVWNASSTNLVNLASVATDLGEVDGMWGNTQVGILNDHASLWHGTAASRVDLHPGTPGIFASWLYAVSGNEQAGIVQLSGVQHAAVWHSTAASFVDLNPAGAAYSTATATDGTREYGYVVYQQGGSFSHAAIWSGSAASFTDMNPGPGYTSGIAGVGGDQQVGGVTATGFPGHAAIWTGSASSWTDVNPFPGGTSGLWATDGFAQVGDANVPGGIGQHAGLWFGTAASFVDLHAFLPAGYYVSTARAISQANGLYYISGYAYATATGMPEAFAWVGVPSPGAGMVLVFGSGWLAGRRRRT